MQQGFNHKFNINEDQNSNVDVHQNCVIVFIKIVVPSANKMLVST